MKDVKKLNVEEETMLRLKAARAAATPDDVEQARAMVKRALESNPATDIQIITPGVAAIIFLEHNRQNREWDYHTSLRYEREIKKNRWKLTNNGAGFLKSGNLGDGGHRFAAIALSGCPVELVIVYGMEESAIVVLDSGKRRQAADALHIQHVDQSRKKAGILNTAYGYLGKLDSTKKNLPTPDIVSAVHEHDHLLNEAIRLGENSIRGVAKPTLTVKDAQCLSFLLLLGSWPSEVIREKLALFQTGQDSSENSPMFIAAKQLERDPSRDEFTPTKRLAVAIQAFQLDEQGKKAVKASAIRSAMLNVPNPAYPQGAM